MAGRGPLWQGVGHHGRSLPSHPLHGAVWPKLVTNDEAVPELHIPGLSRKAGTNPHAARGVFLMLLWMPLFRWHLNLLSTVPIRSLPPAANPLHTSTRVGKK